MDRLELDFLAPLNGMRGLQNDTFEQADPFIGTGAFNQRFPRRGRAQVRLKVCDQPEKSGQDGLVVCGIRDEIILDENVEQVHKGEQLFLEGSFSQLLVFTGNKSQDILNYYFEALLEPISGLISITLYWRDFLGTEEQLTGKHLSYDL